MSKSNTRLKTQPVV